MSDKAGIITLYGESNYGNKLQNYAVIRVLSDLGLKSETLAMINSPRYKLNKIIKNLYCFLQIKKNDMRKLEWMREHNFRDFTKTFIPTRHVSAKHKITDKIQAEYAYFVIGSDQVWNPTFGYYRDQIDDMFLMFTNESKKISFSPSIGISEIPDRWKSEFRDRLKTFKNISIREESSKEIIYKLSGLEATVLIDPTLMLNSDDWLKISNTKIIKSQKPYVLEYFLGLQNEMINITIDDYASIHQLMRKKLVDKNDPTLYVYGPSEFITLISKARIICTDSFHATVFSILFDKPFIVFDRVDKLANMNSRLVTLLQLFNINYEEVKGKKVHIPKDVVQEVLSKERKKVIDFLRKSIEDNSKL